MWNSVTECCLKLVNQFTRRKSAAALYASKGVSKNLGGVMATPRNTVPTSPEEYPISVARPEIMRRPPFKHQNEEIVRSYIKPPPTRTIEMEGLPSGSTLYSPTQQNQQQLPLSLVGYRKDSGSSRKIKKNRNRYTAGNSSTISSSSSFTTQSFSKALECSLSDIHTMPCQSIQSPTRVQRHLSNIDTEMDEDPPPPYSEKGTCRQSDQRTSSGKK